MGLCHTIRMPEKIALVTGASSGFGLLTSIELANAGFRVVATMRDLGRRERLSKLVRNVPLLNSLEGSPCLC